MVAYLTPKYLWRETTTSALQIGRVLYRCCMWFLVLVYMDDVIKEYVLYSNCNLLIKKLKTVADPMNRTIKMIRNCIKLQIHTISA